MSKELWDRREKFVDYMQETFGYVLHDWAEIDDHAPVKSVRVAATEFLGKGVKVSNDEAKQVLRAAEGNETYRSGPVRFFDPNVFITLVGNHVELN